MCYTCSTMNCASTVLLAVSLVWVSAVSLALPVPEGTDLSYTQVYTLRAPFNGSNCPVNDWPILPLQAPAVSAVNVRVSEFKEMTVILTGTAELWGYVWADSYMDVARWTKLSTRTSHLQAKPLDASSSVVVWEGSHPTVGIIGTDGLLQLLSNFSVDAHDRVTYTGDVVTLQLSDTVDLAAAGVDEDSDVPNLLFVTSNSASISQFALPGNGATGSLSPAVVYNATNSPLNGTLSTLAFDSVSQTLAAGSEYAVYELNLVSGKWIHTFLFGIVDDVATALAFDPESTLWIGNSMCANLHYHSNGETFGAESRAGRFQRVGALQGLPFGNISSVASSMISSSSMLSYAGEHVEEGKLALRMFIGIDGGGLVVFEESEYRRVYSSREWYVFRGMRWLVNDTVDIVLPVLGGHGVLCFHGDGISFLYLGSANMDEKAAHYERAIRERHLRDGALYVYSVLPSLGSPSSSVPRCDESDGLWTGMFVGGMAYGVAVDPSDRVRREMTWQSFEALERLVHVTGIAGLPARTYGYASEQNCGYGNWWHNSTTIPGMIWQGDTSSDEIAGHMFAYPLVHDFVATSESERSRVSYLVTSIVDYIIANGYQLYDITGQPTRWGRWDPHELNDIPFYQDERGLNSLEMLSMLLSAYSMSGNETYLEHFDTLNATYGYVDNVLNGKITTPDDDNHSDNNLGFLSYHALFYAYYRLEEGSALRARLMPYIEPFRVSISRWWQFIADENGALWNGVFAGPAQFSLSSEAIKRHRQMLQWWPLDLIDWGVHNSDRMDITIQKDRDRSGKIQSTLPMKPSERAASHWNANPFTMDSGNGGHSEFGGSSYLLPFWMCRYYNLL